MDNAFQWDFKIMNTAFHIQGTINFPNCYFPQTYLILKHPLGNRKLWVCFRLYSSWLFLWLTEHYSRFDWPPTRVANKVLLTESAHRSAHLSRQSLDPYCFFSGYSHKHPLKKDPLENHFSAFSWMNKSNFKYSSLMISKP